MKHLVFVILLAAMPLISACQTVESPDTSRLVEKVDIVSENSAVKATPIAGKTANCVFKDQSCATVPNNALARQECQSKGGSIRPNQVCEPPTIIKYEEPKVIYR